MTQSAAVQTPQIVIHLKQLESLTDDERDYLEGALYKHCERITSEFPEAIHLELRIDVTGKNPDSYEAHTHLNGKAVDCAARASSPTARGAGDASLKKLERELRTRHDKQIFKQRRSAQKRRTALN